MGRDVTAARWLSGDEQRAWRALLRATAVLDRDLERQVQRDAGMPLTYYVALAMLSEAPGRRLRMSELAEITSSTPSRLSHAVSRMEERGWVRRETCPTDRRGQLAVLTDAGHAALVAAAPGHVEQVRASIFDRLDPDQVAQLTRIMESVADPADDAGRPCPP